MTLRALAKEAASIGHSSSEVARGAHKFWEGLGLGEHCSQGSGSPLFLMSEFSVPFNREHLGSWSLHSLKMLGGRENAECSAKLTWWVVDYMAEGDRDYVLESTPPLDPLCPQPALPPLCPPGLPSELLLT